LVLTVLLESVLLEAQEAQVVLVAVAAVAAALAH
jgi:hypothetical protein